VRILAQREAIKTSTLAARRAANVQGTDQNKIPKAAIS
jgi:hypothetical protein